MRRLEDIPLQRNDRLAIERATTVLKARFPVERIILYGSKARGTDAPDSDIDLLVLTSRALSWPDQERLIAALYPIQLEYGVLLSPLVVEQADWEQGLHSVLPIHDEVERDGVAA